MASYTQNIDLQKLDPQDLFDEGIYNSNAEKIDKAIGGINSALGDTKIVRTSREEYDSITHSADTVYYVTEQDGKVKQYLGDAEISGGGNGGNAPSEAVVYCEPAPETVFAQVNGTNIDLSDPTLWEQGGINADGSGWESSNSSYPKAVRTKEMIAISPTANGLIFTSTAQNGKSMEYAVVCFDENRNPIVNGTWTWTASGKVMYFDNGVHFIQIENKYSDWADCLPSDIASAKLMILEE